MSCPICSSDTAIVIDERSRAPILMHLLYDSAETARTCPVGVIDLKRCLDCGFSWNAAFDSDRMTYDPAYDNCQSHSLSFRNHIDARIELVLAARPDIDRLHVIEVGAGQGDFLVRLIEVAGDRIASATGFDPAWRGNNGDVRGGATMYREYFSASSARNLPAAPNIVISRHTIEHVPRPLEFLASIRSAIGVINGVDVFLETPDIQWIVERRAFEDVFYEHCSIFDPPSLSLAMQRSGFGGLVVTHCFGGQYLWAHGKSVDFEQPQPLPYTPARQLLDSVSLISMWRQRLDQALEGNAKIMVWGAGAKGMTFAQLVDPECVRIAGIVDINPNKQGRHIGASGHPVVSPDALGERRPTHIVVMNPIYAQEIGQHLARLGVKADVLPLHVER